MNDKEKLFHQIVETVARCTSYTLRDGSQSITQETGETDAEGNPLTETIPTDDTDNGGYFRVSANKIYMAYAPSAGGNAMAFHFDFGGVETAIGQLQGRIPENAVIYDLQGRRLARITQPGLYIVNGVKCDVNAQNIR